MKMCFLSSAQHPPASVVNPPEMLSPAARCYACRHFTVLDLSWISRQLLFHFLKYFFFPWGQIKYPLCCLPPYLLQIRLIFGVRSLRCWWAQSVVQVHAWPVTGTIIRSGDSLHLCGDKNYLVAKATDAFSVTIVKKRTEKTFCIIWGIKPLAIYS